MRKIIQIAKWLWAWYSYNFAGVNYVQYKCDMTRKINNEVCECSRMKHHLGKCDIWGEEYKGPTIFEGGANYAREVVEQRGDEGKAFLARMVQQEKDFDMYSDFERGIESVLNGDKK